MLRSRVHVPVTAGEHGVRAALMPGVGSTDLPFVRV